MKVYAIENDLDCLLLVTRSEDWYGNSLRVVNGSYEVHENENGSVSCGLYPWKAYYLMDNPISEKDDCDKIFDAVLKVVESRKCQYGPMGA